MMIVSYFLGQKYYPVPYDLKRFFLYLAIAVGIFFLQSEITVMLPDSVWFMKYFTAALLMAMFLGIVYVIETGKVRFLKVI